MLRTKILELIRERKDSITDPGIDEELVQDICNLFPIYYTTPDNWFYFDKLPKMLDMIDIKYPDGTIAYSRVVGNDNLKHYQEKAAFWKYSDNIKQIKKKKF